jgi:hypothetical protein
MWFMKKNKVGIYTIQWNIQKRKGSLRTGILHLFRPYPTVIQRPLKALNTAKLKKNTIQKDMTEDAHNIHGETHIEDNNNNNPDYVVNVVDYGSTSKEDGEINLEQEQEQDMKDKAYFGVQKKTSAMCCSFREIICILLATVLLTAIVGAFTAIGISSLVINSKCPQYNYEQFQIDGGHGDVITREYELTNSTITQVIFHGDYVTRFIVNETLTDKFIVRILRRSWSSTGYRAVRHTITTPKKLPNQLIYETKHAKIDFTDCVVIMQEIVLPANLSNYDLIIRSYTKDIFFPDQNNTLTVKDLTIQGGINELNIQNVDVKGLFQFTMSRGIVNLSNMRSLVTIGAGTAGKVILTNYTSLLSTLKTDDAILYLENYNCMDGNITTETKAGGQIINGIRNAQNIGLSGVKGTIYLTLNSDDFSGRYKLVTTKGNIKIQQNSTLTVPDHTPTVHRNSGFIGSNDTTRTLSVNTAGGKIRWTIPY